MVSLLRARIQFLISKNFVWFFDKNSRNLPIVDLTHSATVAPSEVMTDFRRSFILNES